LDETWVIDSSSLIILGKLSLLHILPQLCNELIIPEGVAREIAKGPRNDRARIWLDKEGKGYLRNIEPINLVTASWDLGQGETEVISYCYAVPQKIAIIDDKAAKKCAEALSISVKGTLAIIILAKKSKLIPKAKPVLKQMIDAGFRIKNSLYEKILEIVEE
jgi:predicted nucleic acid-binding protein